MADATSTLRINVVVQGADQVRGFASAFAQIRTGATTPLPVVAGVRRGGANTTADRTAQNAANQVARFITGAIAQPLVAPINVVGASVRMASGSLVSFLGPLASAATAVAGGTTSILALGVAIYAVGIPLFNLAATWKILRWSWGLAADRAEEQFRTIARTRRTFPGLVGEAFEQAQNQMETKLDVTEALFGDAAASLDERITRLFTDVRLQRGMRGERDIFARWGITPQAVQLMERERGGERMNVTDWLAFFIKRREQLDARILASPVGSAEHQSLVRRRAVLFDDSIKLFGTTFTDLLGVWNTEDLKRLTDNMEKSNSLSDVENAAQKSIDFKIALESTRYTFERLRLGIGRDVQPAITGMMTDLNDWLLQTDDQGQSMGMILRQLLTAFAKKTWEAIVVLVDQIDTETVKAWVEYIKTGWNPQESISLIEWGISAVEKVTNMFDALAHTFFQMKKLGPWQLALLFGLPGAGGPILRGAGVLEEWTPGAGRRAAANAAAEAQGRPPPYPEVGRRRSMLERYGLPGVGETWGGRTPEGRYGAGGEVPQGVLSGAAAAALAGGQPAVDRFMRQNGYPRSGAWCGQFAAAVVTSQGLRPPPNPQVAGNWKNWGAAVTGTPQPGDVLVRRGVSPRTGVEGRHVTFVESYDPATGRVVTIGGNQGGRSSGHISQYYVRRAAPVAGAATGAATTPTAVAPGGASRYGGGGANQMMGRLMGDLQRDFNLTREQAAGVVGNLAHETGGFTLMQEARPIGGGRGGYGLAQWTGVRRQRFESWAAAQGLDPSSYEANYGYLKHELSDPTTREGRAISHVQRESSVLGSMYAFEREFERAGIKHYGRRQAWARRALLADEGMEEEAAVPVPADGGRVRELQQQVAGTRRLALASSTRGYLEAAAAATGVEVEVTSGGQARIGTGGPRTGSTRHDLGGAADIQLRDPQTGRLLDMTKSADAARMAQFTAAAVQAGATGVGAGVGYMGAHRLHIGGGRATTWGGAPWIRGAWAAGMTRQGRPLAVAASVQRARPEAEDEAREHDDEAVRAKNEAAAKETATARELLQSKQAERNREALTQPPPKKSIDEGKRAGEAAADAFKEGVKEVSIPVKSIKESDQDKERERTRDEEEKKAA